MPCRLTVHPGLMGAFFVLVVAACGGPVAGALDATPDAADAPTDSLTDAQTTCVAVARTCAEIAATFATNSTNVSVTCDAAGGTFTIRSTGVPNYASNQMTPNSIVDQQWVVTLPLQPACATATTDVLNSRGAIGFMINGVPFYGPQDAMGRDAVINEGPSFDDCDGHADMSCSYHYHEEPVCVFGLHDTAAMHLEPDGHPPVIGYGLDGFALYASYATTTPLDACNGHSDATRGYHYHASATAPYLLGCYRGTRSGQVMNAMMLCNNGVPIDAGTSSDAGGGG